jgi:hypothetical protein
MDPVDRRQLPLTEFAGAALLATLQPIFAGFLRAVLSKQVGTGDVFNFAFLASLWAWSIMDLIWGKEPVAQDMNNPKLSKWENLGFQIVSFFATLFILGPAWPWLVLGFKIVFVMIVVVATLRISSRLIDRCPERIQVVRAKLHRLFSIYYKMALNSTLRGAFNTWDYIDAVRWYMVPWGLRLASQYVEEPFIKKRHDYEYKSVASSSGQIRLLRIHKQYLFCGHMRCSMEIFPLHDAPKYEALSYRWGFGSEGSELQYRTILVDDKILRVPKSAWELLHARSTMYNDRLVWIDAICINQKDLTEKASQIPLMDQIYTKSFRTIVWPGDRFDSGMASRMLLRLYVANYIFQAKDGEFLLFFEYEMIRPAWRAMIALFENLYFTRMWCIQEVALGQNVEIFHGNKYIPWDVFTETLVTYMRPGRRALLTWSTEDAMDKALWPSSIEGPSSVIAMDLVRQQQHSGKGDGLHIGSMLAHCAPFHATVAKDRIFGVNGLIPGTDKVTPNYNLSDSEIFIAASVLALNHHTQPFAALIYAGIGWGPQEPGVPSWVVNFARPCNHFALSHAFDTNSSTPGNCSATHLQPEIDIDKDKHLLHIKGFVLDTLWNQTSAITRSSADDKSKTRFQRLLLRSQWYLNATKLSNERFKNYPFTNQSRQEAFWRTVLTDRVILQQPAPANLDETHIWYHKLCEARLSAPFENSRAWHTHMLSTPELAKLYPTTLEQRAKIADFSSTVAATIDGRRFAVTEGGLMCLCPSESHVGDVIVVFHGARTPFLLRKDVGDETEVYMLVGECWVHGFMDRYDRVEGFKAPDARIFTVR